MHIEEKNAVEQTVKVAKREAQRSGIHTTGMTNTSLKSRSASSQSLICCAEIVYL